MSISLKQAPASSHLIKYSPTDQTLFLKSLHTQSEDELNDVFQKLQNDKKADAMSLATFLKSLVPFVTSSEGLRNLMQLFIRNISDKMEDILKDESLTTEAQMLVKDFWSLCSIQQASFSLKHYYGQHDRLCFEILPSLASLYIDLFIAVYGKKCESQKFSMRLYSWLMFDMNQRSIKTALLEVTQCSAQGATMVLPLLRKLMVVSTDIKDHLDYLLHVILLRRWSLVCKDLTDVVQMNLGLKAPKHFMDWLQPRWPQFRDHVPLDKGLKGRRVSELILSLDKLAINQLIDVFAECLITGEELSGNMVSVEHKTHIESEPLFVIDKKGRSENKPETSVQKVPAKKRMKISSQMEEGVEKGEKQITDISDEETVLQHKVQKRAKNITSDGDGDDSKITVTPVCMLDKTSSLYTIQKTENKILQGVEEMDVDEDENIEMVFENEIRGGSNKEEEDRSEDDEKDEEENDQDSLSEDGGLKIEMGGEVNKEKEDGSEDNAKNEDNEESQSEDEMGLENEMKEDNKKEEDVYEDNVKNEEDNKCRDEMGLENEMRDDNKEEKDESEDNANDEEDNEGSQSEDEMRLENEMKDYNKEEEDESEDDMKDGVNENGQSEEIVDRNSDTGAEEAGYFIDRKADGLKENIENTLPFVAAADKIPGFSVNQKGRNSPKKIEKKLSSTGFGISYLVDMSEKQTSSKKSVETFSTPRTEVIDGTEITIYDTSLAQPVSKTLDDLPHEHEDMSTRKQFNNIIRNAQEKMLIKEVDHQTYPGDGKDSVVQNSKEGGVSDNSEFYASEMPSSESVEHEVSRMLSEIRKSTENAQVSHRLTRLRSKSEHEGGNERFNAPKQSNRRKTLTGVKSPTGSSEVRSISSESTLQHWLRKPVSSSAKQGKLQGDNSNSSFNSLLTQTPLSSSNGKSASSPRHPQQSLKYEKDILKTPPTMSEMSTAEIPSEERNNETKVLRRKSVQSLKSTRQASKTVATSKVSTESMGPTGTAESDLQIPTPRTPKRSKAAPLSKMPYNLRETPVKKKASSIDKVDVPEDNLATLPLSDRARKRGTKNTPRKSPIVSPGNRRKSLRSSTKQS